MKHLFNLLIILATITLCSCDNHKAEKEQMQTRIDSLLTVNKSISSENEMMSAFVQTFSDGLDSISKVEKLIETRSDENGNVMTKDKIQARVNSLAEYINQQREKISNLEKQLEVEKKNEKLNKVINYLKAQLEEKELRIQELSDELTSAKASINALTNQNKKISQQVDEQNMVIKEQDNVLKTQSDMLNEG